MSDNLSDSERLVKIETKLDMFFAQYAVDNITVRLANLEKRERFLSGAIWILGPVCTGLSFLLNKLWG